MFFLLLSPTFLPPPTLVPKASSSPIMQSTPIPQLPLFSHTGLFQSSGFPSPSPPVLSTSLSHGLLTYTHFLRLPGLQTELTRETPQRNFLNSQEVLCLPLPPQFSVSALRGFPADLYPLFIAVFHLSWCVNSMKAKPTWAVFPFSFAGISPAPGI